MALMSELLARAEELAGARPRTLLGITGPPGAGKSTLAGRLADALGPDRSVVAPMDGFHLADAELVRLGRRRRKGAPDTFDRAGFAAALTRLRAAGPEVVYLPRFERAIEDAIAGAIAVPATVALVVVEGNYLLHWPEVHALLDECWYLDPPDAVRVPRLVDRHVEFGKDPDEATAWVLSSDERNAELIATGRHRADRIIGDYPDPER